MGITGRFYKWTGAALGAGLAKKNKKGMTDVSGIYPDSLKIGNTACGEAVLGFVCMDDSRRVFVAS